MLELALVVWVLTWCVKNAVADVKYAALGKTPPRYQLRMARLTAAGKPATVPSPRYGSREWMADLWADGLQAHTERRRARSTKRKVAELDAAVGEALAVAAPVEPAQEAPKPAVVEPAPAPEPPAPTPAQESGPGARVIPMFRTPVKEEVPAMSEITGLQSAIAYAEAQAHAAEQNSLAGGEAYLSSLQGFEVSGQAIEAVALAQEASSDAAAAWRYAAAELAKQLTVKEAYDAVPDAGSKAFVQGE